MKKIIALRGRSNVGKSQTIKEVYNLLLSKYKNVKTEQYEELVADIKTVLIINGAIKIGIVSVGDPNSISVATISIFAEIDCNIIICATRTRGQTVEGVNNLVKTYEYEVLWLEQDVKLNASEYSDSNSAMAQRILDEV